MIQILDKYGNSSIDDGKVMIIDKNGNVKGPASSPGGTGADVTIDCGTFLAPNENIEIDCGSSFI